MYISLVSWAEGFLFMADDLLISPTAISTFSFSLPALHHGLPELPCSIDPANMANMWTIHQFYRRRQGQLSSLYKKLSKSPPDSLGQRCIRNFLNITGQRNKPFANSHRWHLFHPDLFHGWCKWIVQDIFWESDISWGGCDTCVNLLILALITYQDKRNGGMGPPWKRRLC